MKVIIARHCQTDWNAEGRVQGITDNQLNEKGRAQAKMLAQKLANVEILAIYASDLSRAAETAAIIGDRVNVPVVSDVRLRECDFGSLEGLTHFKFFLASGFKNSPLWPDPLKADFSPFGGDSAWALFERQRVLFDGLKEKHGDETIAVVGHGRSLRTFLVPMKYPHRFFRHGKFIVIDY